MVAKIIRWLSRWLDSRGLGSVADALDRHSAEVGDVEAMHDIARRAMSRSDAIAAIEQLEIALTLKPDDPALWCSKGAAHRHAGQFDHASEAYEKALALRQNYPQVLSNLGELLIARGQSEDALAWLDKALVYDKQSFEARLNKTAALFELARYSEARALAETLVDEEPDRAEAYLNLGNVLVHTGKSRDGIKHYKKALELQPGYPEAHFNLAVLLGSRADLANTITFLERRLKDRGDSIQTLGMLASAHQAAGHLGESEELCHRILERQPDNMTALVTLGSCLSSGGNSAAAVDLYKKVVELDNSQAVMGSNVLFEYNNLSGVSREDIFKNHLDWAEKFELPLIGSRTDPINDRTPGRKLRIGYVSGDFTRHPVGFLLRDVLRNHDASKFEIYCFSMLIRPEEILPELREAADVWEDIFFLNDEEVVELIRKYQIDILVDLSGHTAFTRLLAFALRPAPVQVEWIGYFHSTGMTSIDYFITDPYTSPVDGGQLFSEIPVYLPHTRFGYGPPEYAPDVVAPPFERTGLITFGSFNRLSKLTDEVIKAWSKILQALSESRLVIKSGVLIETTVRTRLLDRFSEFGIDPDRLDLRENSSHDQMLAEYGDIDIALDSFPFNGGMTTLEALWMGVPVVTIAGDTVVSRQTVSVLQNIGYPELAFSNIDDYIQGALALAKDKQRLVELRQTLRPKMAASPIRQSEQFVRDLEALYRSMWEAYCKGEKLPAFFAPDRMH